MIKSMDENENKMKQLSQKEIELMEKLKNTFQKFNEFTDQAQTFDNVTQSIMSNINYSRKALKPLSRFVDHRRSDNRSVDVAQSKKLVLSFIDRELITHDQTGNFEEAEP